MGKSLLKFRPIIFCEISPGGSEWAGSNVVELFNYVIDNYHYTAKILENKEYKKIDKNYIQGITDNINCYFFPI
jgi:hypothetical protein